MVLKSNHRIYTSASRFSGPLLPDSSPAHCSAGSMDGRSQNLKSLRLLQHSPCLRSREVSPCYGQKGFPFQILAKILSGFFFCAFFSVFVPVAFLSGGETKTTLPKER